MTDLPDLPVDSPELSDLGRALMWEKHAMECRQRAEALEEQHDEWRQLAWNRLKRALDAESRAARLEAELEAVRESCYQFGTPQPDRYNQRWRKPSASDNRVWQCDSCKTYLNRQELLNFPEGPAVYLCPDCTPIDKLPKAICAAIDREKAE